MEIDLGLALFRVFRNDRSAFGYSGLFNDELTARLLDIADAVSESGGKRGKLSFLLVEAYQNIIRHRAPLPPEIERGEGRSFFLFCSAAKGHHLVAINPVHRSKVVELQNTLDRINGLDKAELKDLFLDRLQAEQGSGRGAGLGFIEMARRSGSDLGYLLRGLGPSNALFAFGARLDSNAPYCEVIGNAAILHGTVVMNDVLFFQVGAHAQKITDALLGMLANDVDDRPDLARSRTRVFALMLQVLGNDRVPTCGISVVGRQNDSLVYMNGRVMHEEQANELTRRFSKLCTKKGRSDATKTPAATDLTDGDDALEQLHLLSKEPLRLRTEQVADGTLVILQAVE